MQNFREALDFIKMKYGKLETKLEIINLCLQKNDAKRLERLLNKRAANLPREYSTYFSSVFAEAALQGHNDVVSVMINNGLDGGVQCQTHALMHAVQNDDLDLCLILLRAKADVSRTDCSGDGLLAIAAWRNSATVIPALIKAGCQLNAFNKSSLTPLHIATRQEHLEVQCVLLQHGADTDLRDTSMMYGYSPLELAIMSGNRTSIQNLIMAGSKIDMRRLNDRTFVKNTFEADPGIEELLGQEVSQPKSLLELSRRKLRWHLSPNCVEKTKLLPLPTSLIEFVMMSREFAFEQYKVHLKTHDMTLMEFL